MKYLKEKFGKYFQFKNTTNGTDYFLRGLATLLFLIPFAIALLGGVALINTSPPLAAVLVVLSIGMLIPMIWFSLATTYKRINAFFPGKAGWLTALTFVYSMITEGFNPNQAGNQFMDNQVELSTGDSTIYIVLILPYLAWSLYLLFGNSKVKKHIG